MNIAIRLAKPDDAIDIAEIVSRSWEAAYKDIIPMDFIKKRNENNPALFQRIITNENTTHYVIQVSGKTVGIMCIASPQDDDVGGDFFELHGIYLHPDYFRKGIGTHAMNYAFAIARNLGKKHMTVWVFDENINAIKFYEKCGFKAENKTKAYDCKKVMKCLRLKKDL